MPRISLPMFCLAVLAVALAACGKDAADQPSADARAQAFAASQQAWRQARHTELTQPDGWPSVVGLHWIETGEHYVGSDADNGIRLALGPAHLGMLSRTDDRIRFVPERGTALMLDGKPLQGAATVLTDAHENGPSKLAFDEGKGLITVIKRADRYALRVRHANAPARTGFKGVEYWPGGEDWIVSARFVPNAPGTTLAIANIVGTTENVPNPGALEFERDGRIHRIQALDEGGEGLFLVFADRTSGQGSYPAGRFLDVARPDAGGTVVLDLNKAYNPPCAFTAFATCPLPPPENRLDLEITAGEKNYHFEEPQSS